MSNEKSVKPNEFDDIMVLHVPRPPVATGVNMISFRPIVFKFTCIIWPLIMKWLNFGENHISKMASGGHFLNNIHIFSPAAQKALYYLNA